MPPVASTVALPLKLPSQLGLVKLLILALNANNGSPISTLEFASQPLVSVTVSVVQPVSIPVTARVPSPAGDPFQLCGVIAGRATCRDDFSQLL